jgi:hypothetical protein
MSEYHYHSPASLVSLVALCERIEAEAPHLTILAVYEFPKPFIKVRDTEHGIVVGFSSEAEYVTYCQIVSRTGGSRHA